MPQAPLSAHKIRKLLFASLAPNFNKTKTANQLRIARNSATKYINAFSRSALTTSELERARRDQLYPLLFPIRKSLTHSNKISLLADRLAAIHSRIENDGLSLLDTWREGDRGQFVPLQDTQDLHLFMLLGGRKMVFKDDQEQRKYFYR